MFEAFRKNLETKIAITDEEFTLITSVLKPTVIKRKKDLLQIGQVCNHLAYVQSGCLRSFSIDTKGNERVIQIALEDFWIADLSSFIARKEGQLCIEALEDTKVLLLRFDDLENLFIKIPVLERFFRILYGNAYVATLERLNNVYSETAEVRYNNLLSKYPTITQRIPLIHIASFLGITPESLSRIRKNK